MYWNDSYETHIIRIRFLLLLLLLSFSSHFNKRAHPATKATEVTSDRPAWWDRPAYQVNHTRVCTIEYVSVFSQRQPQEKWMNIFRIKRLCMHVCQTCVSNLSLSMWLYLTIDFGRSVCRLVGQSDGCDVIRMMMTDSPCRLGLSFFAKWKKTIETRCSLVSFDCQPMFLLR